MRLFRQKVEDVLSLAQGLILALRKAFIADQHPLNADATSYLTNYSTVEMYHQGGWQTLEFPFEYELNNLYVDDDNRLYVSAATWQYVQDNQITGPDEQYPGLIYLYQEPLP